MLPASLTDYPPEFARSHAVTAEYEGGWSNHKDDPGGATMYGVTQARYDSYYDLKGLPHRTVRGITIAEALDIYFNFYWLAAKCDALFPGVDLAVYDASVNSGVGRGRKWLAASAGSNDHSVTVKRICQKRLSFVQGLRTFKTFGRGWSRRIAGVQATGVAWALEAMRLQGTVSTPVPEALQTEASASDAAAGRDDKGGKAAGGAGVGAGSGKIAQDAVDPAALDMWMNFVAWGVVAAAVFGCLFLLWRAMTRKDQADAYRKAAADQIKKEAAANGIA